MPISLWLKWVGWAKVQGPLGGLGDDLRHAELALQTSILGKAGEERHVGHFLPTGREPSDYLPWGIDVRPPVPELVEED
jgi:hypothetical protein